MTNKVTKPIVFTAATVFHPLEGGPDTVYLHLKDTPSPTSTTKKGVSLMFKAQSGRTSKYLEEVFGVTDVVWVEE